MIHTLIDKTCFGLYGGPKNKIVWDLLRPKADNILPDLGWVVIDGIRAALCVILSDGRINLSENAESLRVSICNTRGESHIGKSTIKMLGL